MPLGDSITEGGGGYRYPLMEKLLAAGYSVEYVGSRTTQSKPDSPLGVLSHEGYSGSSVGGIANRFEKIYKQNPADIILLHSGHNQFAEKQPIPQMLVATRKIIESARSINPHVTVLLAQVIPSGKLPKYSYIPEFNEALIPLAAELNTKESPVILVNHAEGFDWRTDTGGDHVHPNAAGGKKMAMRWFEALQKILPPPTKKPSGFAHRSEISPLTQIRLWEGPAPDTVENPGPEIQEANGRVSNVSVPMLDVYLPDQKEANGMAIIICSGGGYGRLASGPIGKGAAARFLPEGIAVFSLKYRVRPPSTNVVRDAVADGKRAVQLGCVYELRKMDEKMRFETKIGLLRKTESRFGRLKKPTFGPKGGFQPLSANS